MSNIIKFAVLLVGAILIALIVRVVIASATRPSGPPAVTTEKVQVSAADLPQGLLLRDEDLVWKQVPAAQIPPNAIISGAPNAPDLKGALLRHPVASGAVLVADDVILPSAPGFLAATLKPEMRAVSVAVDDVSGNAGLIQPGDYVDLLLTQQMDRRTDSPDMAVSSETVVEHVRVLAVGSEIKRPKNNATDAPETGSRARTVTLEVTPRMGEVVAVAARLGSLSLALRSFATVTRDPAAAAVTAASSSERSPIWAGDISRAVRDLPRSHKASASTNNAPPPVPRTVVIYRGSEKADGAGAQVTGAADGAPPLPTVASQR
ncbi:Flp pilus assembly protein CpaB [Caballeronia humi]|uniref:Flp pilus assembly CpaB n=1 Tax=Caballeronia humi TaxID=326474 RepID=A0A158H6G6_9BURK|nr:Flp pilus assembly protein CpaB [Caballeronia humi]SAL39757.1 Flp pilus assembly CpaB [Caballeronia humi]